MAHQTSQMRANITKFAASPEVKEIIDTSPSDIQPPGVDDDEPQSLEEALLGE